MPYATQPKIGAGSTLHYEDPVTPGTFIECPWMTDMGESGDSSSFADATPLRSTSEVKIPGEATAQEAEFRFIDVPGDQAHEDFIDLAKAEATVTMRKILSNGRQMEFDAALGKPKWPNPERANRIEVIIPYTKSGDLTHSEV